MRRDVLALLLLASAIGLGALGSQVSGAASVVLLGDQAVEPGADSNPAGSAEAFKTTASASGTVATLSVYVDTGSTAGTLVAGLYADAAGKPGVMLGSGTLIAPAAGAWSTVALTNGVPVTAGTVYWIALLGPSGTLRFRDHPGGSPSVASSQTGLTALPTTWSGTTTFSDGPLSAYGSSAASPTLVVSPSSLTFSASVGGPDPATQTLGISNSGAGALSWTAAKTASWLSVGPSSGPGPATATVSVTTSGLAAGTYDDTITVTATGAQSSPQSIPVQLTLTAPDTTPPSAPTALATSASGNTVALSWTPSTDNVGVLRYDVFRSTTSGFTPSSANRIDQSPTASFADTALAAGTYFYVVEAEDAAGNISGASNEATASVTAPPPADFLAGDQSVEAKGDFNAAGVAEAFKTSAAATGTLTKIAVYVDSTNAATTIDAGLYADNGGRPGALLAQGTLNAPIGGAWNDVTVSSTSVTAGSVYWIALLGPAGGATIRFRDHSAGGSASEVSAQSSLLTLPATWSTGSAGTDGPLSAWAGGAVAGGPPPAQVGQWSAPITWPIVAVHMALLPTGNVIGFDAWSDAPNSQTIWNSTTGTFLPVPDPTNLFCSGHILLPDGRLLVVGGNVQANVGIKDATLFNSATNTWSKAAPMSVGRWYPTATVLGNGKVFVFAGDSIVDNGLPFSGPTYFKEASQSSLPSIYDPSTNTWQDLTGARLTTPLYPFLFQLSDGRILDAGPDVTTRVMNPSTWTWSTVTTSPLDGGDAVMYLPDKIMKSGSYANTDYDGSFTYDTAPGTAVIDMSQANPTWRTTAPMHYPRAYHNLTLLPDGTVLASGGSTASDGTDLTKAVLPAEIWDPTTETWTVVASLRTGREYHSTALLLPDGRVLMAGGGQLPGRATNIYSGEVYSPPYLFKGTRPTITSAPSVVGYGSSFTVTTPDAASIQKVALIRTPSVTHAFDENQRYIPLSFTAGSGQLTVQAPPNGNTAPPGYYMLFVLNGNGVPSVASFVRFPAPWEDTQAPSAPTKLAATGGTGSVSLSWTASTDNVGVTAYDVYRSTTSGFVPAPANKVGRTAGTTFTDGGLAAGTYFYVVKAEDAAGNLSGASNEASAAVTSADSSPPSVSITAPAAGATVTGTVTVAASAADNVGVAGVQFQLDGNPLGPELTAAPHSMSWDTAPAANGTHALTAVARDAAGNRTTSAAVTVDVENAAASPTTYLFGTQTVEPVIDQNVAGLAEAFRTTSTSPGTVRTLRVFVATGSAATAVTVGLYSDAGGHPGTLLTQATLSAPVANAWNDVSVPAAAAPAGTYWIAILGPTGDGTVKFRDATGAGGAAETSAQTTLSSLPATWSTGTHYGDGPLSGYALGTIP